MKLIFKNFRCYVNKTFDFGKESGILLLSGPSGAGKTTILQGINFVLFDKGTKLITFGKTSCSVEFQFDGWTIVRTKRPNRVVLRIDKTGEEYEDAAAQGMINKRYGKSFDITSYVQQNTLKSFIIMSPTDKLAFLEHFAFDGIDLVELKMRCKANIKNHHDELLSITSKLEQATEYLSSLTMPEKVSFPLKKTTNKERAIKNEKTRYKNCNIRINKVSTKLSKLLEKYNDLNVLLAKKETMESTLEQIDDKIENLSFEKKTITYDGDSKLQKHEKMLNIVISRRELMHLRDTYDQDKQRLQEMTESELSEMNSKITEISSALWTEYTQSEVNTLIEDYTQMVSDIQEIKRLEKSLESYSDNIDADKLEQNKRDLATLKEKLIDKKEILAKLKLQQELYACPNCDATLHFNNDGLELYDEELSDNGEEDIATMEKEIKSLTTKINRLEYIIPEQENYIKHCEKINRQIKEIKDGYEDPLPTKTTAENELNYIQQYLRSQQELIKIKRQLEQNKRDSVFSSTLTTFSNSLEKLKSKIQFLKEKDKDTDCDTKIDEQELRQTIQIQKQNKLKLAELEQRICVLQHEREELQEQISEIVNNYTTIHGEIVDKSFINTKIKQIELELTNLKNDYKLHQENVLKIDQYQKYVAELARYNEWKERVNELTDKEVICRKKYAGATLLKDKILEAESLAIANIVNGINTHAQDYLDKFFPVDPIAVQLHAFKETKKSTKPQINLQIDYKGMEMDITMLSGGELARVVLAYTLALAEIFNSPLIMLDECTASIDQDLTGTVIDGIKENFANRLVLVIAHQVVSGIFDDVIEINPV